MLVWSLLLFLALPQDTLLGFRPEHRAAHRQVEARILAALSPDRARRTLQAVTAVPHPTGTAGDSAVVTLLGSELERLGFDRVETVQYDVWLPYPRRGELRLTGPDSLTIVNREATHP